MSAESSWIDLDDEDRVPLTELADRPMIVAPETTCDEVDQQLTGQCTTTSVLVSPGLAGAGIGIISRDDFGAAMRGSHGYGRALWGRRPIAELVHWQPRVVPATGSLSQAAAMLTEANGRHYSDLVVVSADGSPVGVLRPTAVMEALAKRFAHHATRDALTGVASRAAFLAGLGRMQEVADRERHAIMLAFVDLDGLKEVNDSFGHAAGDAMLRAVAERLGAALEPADLLGRLGGDEFGVARLVCDPQAKGALARPAAHLGEDLRAAAAAGDSASSPAASLASVGVAYSLEPVEPHELLRCADSAMYEAKVAGGNRAVIIAARHTGGARTAPGQPGFVLGMGAEATPRILAIEGQLEVHYQPIISTLGGRTRGIEALLRQRVHTELLGPSTALATAERQGLCADLDLWVLSHAAGTMVAWCHTLGDTAPEYLDVNLAPGTLHVPNVADRILRVLGRAGLAPGRVRLELSERCSVAELRDVTHQLDQLRAAGVQFTIDDLGSSLSSVRHVIDLNLDGLKIDRSLVEGVVDEPAYAAIISALVTIAARRGIPATAEGVEHADQFRALQQIGVHDVQGSYLARPMSATALTTWIRARTEVPVPATSAPPPPASPPPMKGPGLQPLPPQEAPRESACRRRLETDPLATDWD